MKKIVIIGANDFQKPLIQKAKEMGYETHVFAWREGATGAEDADFFYEISIVEMDPGRMPEDQTGCSCYHRLRSCEYHGTVSGRETGTSGKQQ